MMNSYTSKKILLILLGVLGSGALFGGGVLIISPSGMLFGMPLSLLKHSPFHNFLLPGLILFTVLGLLPLLLVMALIRKPTCKFAELFNCYKDMYWAWTYSIYIAFALILWIQTEMTILHAVHWSHTLYMVLALAIIFVALLPKVRRLYVKPG